MCGSTQGGLALDSVDLDTATVIQGSVVRGGNPVNGAYVRLLDSAGEFTAEVPTSATGQFRFFAAPGRWTLRALTPNAPAADRSVVAGRADVAEVVIAL